MQNPVIIFGAKQLGAVAQEIFQSNDVLIYCFLDDDKQLHNTELNDISIMGDTDDEQMLRLLGKKCEAFVAIEDQTHRKSLFKTLTEEYQVMPVNAVHQRAAVSGAAVLGHGNLIGPGAVVNTNARMGNLNVVHANAVVDYYATLGSNVQVGTGAVISANATVEDGAFIGAGAIIIGGVTIGKGARIGAGSVVIADVQAKETVFGNPAAAVKA